MTFIIASGIGNNMQGYRKEKKMKISLIASSVRECLYQSFFDSLKDTQIEWEAVFAGPKPPKEQWPNLTYIETKDIKPAQCYEVARRHSKGELILWCADDCEFIGGILDKAYEYWKSKDNKKLILSLQTKESAPNTPEGGVLFDMGIHRFFGGKRNAPLMAPLGLMHREWLEDLGGIDARYICGQYENDIVMRAYAEDGTVEIFGDDVSYVYLDHLGKSLQAGECSNNQGFYTRPFATGYQKDRAILEGSWSKPRTSIIFNERVDAFVPYKSEGLLERSQEGSGQWI